MVLGKLLVPGHPNNLVKVGYRPIALAVRAGGGVWTFFFSSVISLLFPGRQPYID